LWLAFAFLVLELLLKIFILPVLPEQL